MASTVNLYTEEYFRLARRRLKPGGMISYWLPVYIMSRDGFSAAVRGFCAAFPDCSLWSGIGEEWILLGSRNRTSAPEASEFSRLWRLPAAASELRSLGLETPCQLAATFLADSQQLNSLTAGYAPLIDDFPKRLTAGGANGSPFFQQLMEPGGALRRFDSSTFAANMIPSEIRTCAGKYFSIQPTVLSIAGTMEQNPPEHLPAPALIDILSSSSLEAVPMWLMGSSSDKISIADQFPPSAPKDGALINYHQGVAAMALRHFTEAAHDFDLAFALDSRGVFNEARVMAYCLAGKAEDALAALGGKAISGGSQAEVIFQLACGK